MARYGTQRGGGGGKAAFFQLASGLARLQSDLRREFDDVVDDIEDSLWDALDAEILQPANLIVPYDTGRLHDSGYVNVVRSRGRVSGIVGYDTDYALYVHENPDAYHKPPTRWKWLEETFATRTEQLLARVERDVRERQ